MMGAILELFQRSIDAGLDTVFLKLLNMSICAGWLALAVIALRILLKKAPKWVMGVLWAFVAVRLICPFSIESVMSLMPSAETVSPEIAFSDKPAIDSGLISMDQVVNPVIQSSFTPEPMASANPLQIWIPIASFVWVAGMCGMVIYMLASYLGIRRKVREAVRLDGRLWECDHISTPFILGVFRPRIYLPSGLEEADRGYVLAHENAHLKRWDHIWKPVAFLLLAVYWFQPILWVAYILLCRDIELACDERVLRECGTEIKKAYANVLINCSVSRKRIMVCPLAFGEVGVKARVKNVLNYRKPAFWIIITAVIACVVVGVCMLTDPIGSRKEAGGQDPDNKVASGQNQAELPLDYEFEVEYMRTCLEGDSESFTYPAGYILHSREDLEKYCRQNKKRLMEQGIDDKLYAARVEDFMVAIEKYDDAYFEQRELILVLLEESSGDNRHQVSRVRQESDGNWTVSVNRLLPGMGTCDMAYWVAFVEVPVGQYTKEGDKAKVALSDLSYSEFIKQNSYLFEARYFQVDNVANIQEYPKVAAFRSRGELESFCKAYPALNELDGFAKACGNYDEAFFAEQDLILTFSEEAESRTVYEALQIYQAQDSVWHITVQRSIPWEKPEAAACKGILLEVKDGKRMKASDEFMISYETIYHIYATVTDVREQYISVDVIETSEGLTDPSFRISKHHIMGELKVGDKVIIAHRNGWMARDGFFYGVESVQKMPGR
jgi:beta-lactamase regulating signal transducer with metallopeptidase domain